MSAKGRTCVVGGRVLFVVVCQVATRSDCFIYSDCSCCKVSETVCVVCILRMCVCVSELERCITWHLCILVACILSYRKIG